MKKIILLCGLIILSVAGIIANVVAVDQVTLIKVDPTLIAKWKIPDKFINLKISSKKPFRPQLLRILPLPDDKPVVHPMLNFYQEDRRFSNLFSTSGDSMLCGPTSLANILVYLKYNHNPKYPDIFKTDENKMKNNGDWVPFLYDICKTDKDRGTTIYNLESCAILGVEQGGYKASNVFIRGCHSDIDKQRFAPTPEDLRAFSKASPDRGCVLLFGWYSKVKDASGNWIYQRNGGHYVALAGYDAIRKHVFYVSNPLVDYQQDAIMYSKIVLKELPGNVQAPDNVKWYTDDLIGGNFAILEDILVVLPKQ